MTRSKPETPSPPIFSFGILLKARPRLTIPAQARKATPWLRGKKPPVPCLVGFGSERQLVLSSEASSLAQSRERFFAAVKKEPGLLQVAEGERLARYFSATWRCSIQSQFQLTLPEALAKSWMPEDRRVTLLGLPDRIEIWKTASWEQAIADTAQEYEVLLDSLLDAGHEP